MTAPERAPELTARQPITLYFVRHADAGDSMAWAGDDADRPLSGKGRKQAKRLGHLLREVNAGIDVCVSSPKRRAADTAKLVMKALDRSYVVDDRLAQDFGEAELNGLLAELDPAIASVMLVGHDPDFSWAVSMLAGTEIEMRKGALAVIDLPERSATGGRGSLRWLLPPDAVPG